MVTPHHVTEILAERGVRHVAGTLEETHQRRQPGSDQTGLAQFIRKRRNKCLSHVGHHCPCAVCCSIWTGSFSNSTCWIVRPDSSRVAQLAATTRTFRIIPEPIVHPAPRGKTAYAHDGHAPVAHRCWRFFGRPFLPGLRRGLTMSLEGGFEELPECFCALASFACSALICVSIAATALPVLHTEDSRFPVCFPP